MKDDKIVERYTFRYSFGEYDDADKLESFLEFSTEGSTVTELLGKFEQFLRGAGFTFKGEFEVVDHNNFKIVPRTEGNIYPKGQEARSSFTGPVEVTKGAEFGLNITDRDNIYPDESVGAWHRGQTAL